MTSTSSSSDLALRSRVAEVLERIRPAIKADGGDVELADVDDSGVVKVRLRGACIGCPSSSMTLQSGIMRTLKAHIPEVSGVEAVE